MDISLYLCRFRSWSVWQTSTLCFSKHTMTSKQCSSSKLRHWYGLKQQDSENKYNFPGPPPKNWNERENKKKVWENVGKCRLWEGGMQPSEDKAMRGGAWFMTQQLVPWAFQSEWSRPPMIWTWAGAVRTCSPPQQRWRLPDGNRQHVQNWREEARRSGIWALVQNQQGDWKGKKSFCFSRCFLCKETRYFSR